MRLLETSIEAAAHGVVITNRVAEIIWVNPAFATMTGYEREEVIGENPRILKSGVQGEEFYAQMWSSLQRGETWRGELVNRTKDGAFYTERQSIRPVRLNGDEITHFIAIKEDITEKEALRSNLMELDRFRTVGLLASSLAHAINNPLAYAKSNIQMLAKALLVDGGVNEAADKDLGLSSADVEEMLLDTLDGLERIRDAVSSLRIFSTIDGDAESQGAELDAGIEAAIQTVSHLLTSRALLRRDYWPEKIHVAMSKAQLAHLMVNLLHNAITQITDKEPDEAAIGITTRLEGEYAVIDVSDSGKGMSEDELAQVFGPLAVAEGELHGPGVGLVICRNIVENVGGKMQVETQLGEGSVFRVELPRADE
ncbi:MAG: two-component system sensor histidine kinase NtrB [Myxococcota bacterium]